MSTTRRVIAQKSAVHIYFAAGALNFTGSIVYMGLLLCSLVLVLSRTNPLQTRPISQIFIILLSSHLCLGLPSVIFCSKIFYQRFIQIFLLTSPCNINPFDLFLPIIFGENESRISPLCRFLNGTCYFRRFEFKYTYQYPFLEYWYKSPIIQYAAALNTEPPPPPRRYGNHLLDCTVW